MKIKTLAAVALLSLMPAAQACINSVGTDHTGRRFQPGWYTGKELARTLTSSAPNEYWVREQIKRVRRSPDFANLTDIGVVLIRQGQFTRAVEHFVRVERLFPGHHETAANLGTALELSGHDAVALRWIRLGIARNADEHFRTEWLHARILEAKIAMAQDPGYLKGRSIAGVTFAPTLVPPLPQAMPAGNDGQPVNPWQLNVALSYQLHERTQFVRPRDPVVSNLLLDWATLNLAGGPIENADVLYDLAVRYGAMRDSLMARRQAHVRQLLAQTASKEEPDSYDCAICQPME